MISWLEESTPCSSKRFWYIFIEKIYYCLSKTKSFGSSENISFLTLIPILIRDNLSCSMLTELLNLGKHQVDIILWSYSSMVVVHPSIFSTLRNEFVILLLLCKNVSLWVSDVNLGFHDILLGFGPLYFNFVNLFLLTLQLFLFFNIFPAPFVKTKSALELSTSLLPMI